MLPWGMPVTTQRFDLVTQWRLDAPIAAVWAALIAVEAWPDWWRAVRRVELIEPGDAGGLGAVRRMTWRTALPYTLTFTTRTSRIEPMAAIEAQASGELDGVGLWTLRAEGGGTLARYDWRVELGRPWMRALAPVLRPVFAWNHGVVMGWGEADLARHLVQSQAGRPGAA